jgi:hypothetical protein
MPELPIRRIIMYKHGVGYFERRGPISGTELRLSFPREAMDDVLKSLVAIDLGAGQIHGIDFETPEDRAARLAKGSIHLSDSRSTLDLLRDLRGRRVCLHLTDAPDTPLEGTLIGVDIDEQRPLDAPLVAIVLADGRTIRTLPVRSVAQVELLELSATEDLAYFLRASQSEEDRRAATLRLSDGEHDLLVGYVAPAPAWRVSYRVLAEPDAEESTTQRMLLQGWGLFDNQLDEDLEQVALTLVAGMPVSFRYRLYEPHTPERPLIADEQRTVAAPVEFAALASAPPPAAMPRPSPALKRAAVSLGMAEDAAVPEAELESFSIDAVAQSTSVTATGADRGALFQYKVVNPVSVARGQSAMVPIVATGLHGRKDLLYNGRKHPKHPVASLRMRNETGLTLERGPVTVVEAGDYAGEAVLPFTRPGAEVIIPYAVELGVSVVEEPQNERVTSAISVNDQYLLIQEWQVQLLTYRIQSTLDQPVSIVVEQPVPAGHELFETAAPREQAQGLARWEVACAPQTETLFTVRYRRMNSRREQVRGLTKTRLREYLRQKFLDEPTLRGLEDVLAVYAEIEQKQQRLSQIENERNQIYRRQQQIQASLGPIGRDGEEGRLRARYVQQLGEIENQLNAFSQEERNIQAEIEKLEQRALGKLRDLTTRSSA